MARSATTTHAAYILHTRPYRETSITLELLTSDLGRVGAIYKGGRKGGKNKARPESFIHYHACLFGSGELKSVASLEVDQPFDMQRLQGVQLFSAMYVNELLYKALPRSVVHEDIFVAYQDVLLALRSTANFEAHLRHFELRCLTSLGYGLSFDYEADGQTAIQADRHYTFEATRGFCVASVDEINKAQVTKRLLVKGEVLMAIANGQWQDSVVLQSLKRINQYAINDLLKGRPIKSREFLRKSSR
ncbi:MAG: DNA repair protein RecO [Pseudomonadales bacterium]